MKGGPHAIAEAKDLIASVVNRPIDQALAEDTAARIARIRVTAEGQEGTNAFLEKRAAAWVKGSGSNEANERHREHRGPQKAELLVGL